METFAAQDRLGTALRLHIFFSWNTVLEKEDKVLVYKEQKVQHYTVPENLR